MTVSKPSRVAHVCTPEPGIYIADGGDSYRVGPDGQVVDSVAWRYPVGTELVCDECSAIWTVRMPPVVTSGQQRCGPVITRTSRRRRLW